ncbi:uncharacterized protein LOC122503138 [Leptopilina heterotoma]|uniref:uncharacterized protein LOC122503138 n=1 Tax=Leptopilina heterotoma TaxID=63436 RepID=UPI001CA9D251|nr:uncharacterized protein LOC122503138 [Leptopilina heterotoma]
MSSDEKSRESEKINFNALADAVKLCLLENKNIRSTAREHNLDKSTLQRYIHKVKAHFGDISLVEKNEYMEFIQSCSRKIPTNMVFSLEQEKLLVGYILKCVNHYYGLSINDLKELAFQFAKKLDLDYPLIWNKSSEAGKKWYYLFMKRHPELKLRTPEQTSIHRVKAFCKSNVEEFFENLGRLLDKFHFDSTTIYNMDESGFSNVPTKIGKVIALKGMKRIGKVEAAERGTMVTMALTVSANGNSLPPLFLFPRKKMQTYFLDNVSPGTSGFANESGWMTQPEFIQYIRHFIKFVKPSVDSPVLLLMDNHSSHLSVDALDIASKNGVHILSFPPHCSHKLQPLDVSVFGPTKTYYKSLCSTWQKNNANKVLEIRHIAGIVCQTLDLALTPKTIKAGFAKTGIAPFNPNVFSDDEYIEAVQQNAAAVATEANLNENDQLRIIVDPLNIVPENMIIPEASEPLARNQEHQILYMTLAVHRL